MTRQSRTAAIITRGRGACLALLVASGCAQVRPACVPPARPMIRETLYFGLGLPSGASLDATAWQAFLTDTVTPRFPAGYTVLAATGHWRDGEGRGLDEPSRVLIALHPPEVDTTDAIAAIVDTYRRRFAQESVLHEWSEVCARF